MMAKSKTVPFPHHTEPAMSRVQAEADVKSIDPPMPRGAGVKPVQWPMKLWRLAAKDKDEPPFHFTGVARMYVVAAPTEEEARYLAALCSEPHGPVWMDDDMTDCVALAPKEPGVIAQG